MSYTSQRSCAFVVKKDIEMHPKTVYLCSIIYKKLVAAVHMFSFSKDERLCSRKAIDRLFAEGKGFTIFPLRILHLPQETNQILVSVSKRHFKRAIDRNTIKRRIREGYRLNKHLLLSSGQAIGYIYLAKEILPSQVIHEKIKLSLLKIQDEN